MSPMRPSHCYVITEDRGHVPRAAQLSTPAFKRVSYTRVTVNFRAV